MEELYIKNALTTILTVWSTLIQIKNKDTNDPINIVLISHIYELFTCICQLLHLEGNYILDVWERKEYNIEETVNYIVDTQFEPVE